MNKTTQSPNTLPLEELECAAECLKVLAHPVRLQMVNLLLQGRFSVGEIAEYCEIAPNQACEHLRLMKGHGFLDSEREGRSVYYVVSSPRLPGLMDCVRNNCRNRQPRPDGRQK